MRAAMSAIGGKWSLILLYWLDDAPRRFNELQRLVPDISHKVLTEVLRALEDEGLITRAAGETIRVCDLTARPELAAVDRCDSRLGPGASGAHV